MSLNSLAMTLWKMWMEQLRPLARRIGLGRVRHQWRQLAEFGVSHYLKVHWSRWRYLDAHRLLRPLPCGGGTAIHMLLHHGRIHDGIWALYSMRMYAAIPMQIVVHDDGSLTESDSLHLTRLFPGLRLIRRAEADVIVGRKLAELCLSGLSALRRDFIFALKLLDPLILAETKSLILLDSDVITYRRPEQLLSSITACFMPDNRYAYCVPESIFKEIAATSNLIYMNAGLLKVWPAQISLQQLEQDLTSLQTQSVGNAPDFYTEQTLWALQLHRLGAAALSHSGICYGPGDGSSITGHFCGGGYWASLIYTEAIPHVYHDALRLGLTNDSP